MSSLSNWLDQAIENENIRFIKFNDLDFDARNHKKKENPSYSRVPLKSNPDLEITYHTLKDFHDLKIDDKEMATLFKESLHENIITAFISKCMNTCDYYLIIEYANQGDLDCYLENTILTWRQRIEIAIQLTSGLNFLHNKQLVHFNLDPKNVFINNDILKITSFGRIEIFKSNNFEKIPFIEPRTLQTLNPESLIESGNNSQESNVYSLGVLLWYISSGFRPYKNFSCFQMITHIIKGQREAVIQGTPVNYSKLYQSCWQHDPDKRPKCKQILEFLENADMKDGTSNTIDKSHQALSELGKNILIDEEKIYAPTSIEGPNKIKCLQDFNLCKGLNIYGNILNPGEQILTKDGELIFYIKNDIRVYINSIPTNTLKNKSILPTSPNIEENHIRIHIPLLQIEYKNQIVTNEFTEIIEKELKRPDQSFVRETLQDIFEKYGEYIVQNIDIGGALTVKSSFDDDLSLLQEIEILKAQLYWVYDDVVLGKVNVFNKVPFNDHFILKDAHNNDQRILYGYELKSWMKDYYENKNGYIISYNKIIHAYNLLKDEVKQNVKNALECSYERTIKFIPHMNHYDDKDLITWISSSKTIYLRDWVENLHLQYGLVIQPCAIGRGFEIAVEFIGIPDAHKCNNSYMHLRQPSNKKEAFTLTNRIEFNNDTNFLFLAKKLANENPHPIFDNLQASEIHCLIISENVKLCINLDKIVPSKALMKEVNDAINNDFPFYELNRVFNKFGHIWPQKIILGWILSRTCDHTTSDELINDKFSLDINKKSEIQQIILDKLSKWSNSIKNLDTSFFLDSNGEIVNSHEIYEKLRNLNEVKNLNIVKFEDLVPLYKILPESIQKDIENITSDRYHIIMTGVTKIKRENQTYVDVGFVQPLKDNNYEMFGCLIVNNQRISDTMIRFSLANKYGCQAIIHKLGNKNRHTRNVKIIFGQKILKGQLPFTYEISMQNRNFPDSFILVTSFDSKDLDRNQVIKGHIENHSKTSLSLNVSQHNAEEIQSNNIIMKWCLIEINQNDFVISDVEKKVFNWNVLGEVIAKSNWNVRGEVIAKSNWNVRGEEHSNHSNPMLNSRDEEIEWIKNVNEDNA
ncbi:12060_t:CDS:2 [Cetraspora pellucida]|uniref:12060_t:CDS:1 n=1 Tax=Cetraspora pellucida TaxID=1433469 RepID=A0A9N9E7Z1_9GLOM|nr:12060_t:CDS:2 [Cetraspora pellucida]